MVQWESLAERLGVGEADLEGVKEDGSDARRKRELVLKKWKAAQIFDATYRRLGEEFRGLGRADLCLEVFKLAAKAAASLQGGRASGDGTTTSGRAQPTPSDQVPTDHKATGGDQTASLGPDDLDNLYEFLKRAEPSWRDIGRQLKFSHGDLGAIVKKTGLFGDSDHFNELLSLWLKRASERTTVRILADALRSVGEERLANELERDFIPVAQDKFFTDKEEKILDDFAKRVIKEYNVDSSPLDQRLHFPYVRIALIKVADKWKHIGSMLGLTAAELNAIKAKNEKNVDQCLNNMILKWFEKSTFASPATLRQLVRAIATETGGENPAHAESVAKMFQGGLNDVPFAKKVDSTELRGDDSAEVEAALGDVEAKWKEIGIFLGLEIKKLNALDDMVDMWLSKQYDIKHFGNPSWQKLVSAVGSKAGAGDVAAAEDIASKHIDPNFKEAPADAATPAPGSTESAEKVVKITDEDDHCLVRVGDKKYEAYKMNTVTHHGLALIISITEFENGAERNYGKVDEDRLVDLFGPKFLGYKTLLLQNLTAEEILLALELATGTKKLSDIPQFQNSLSDFSDSSNVVSEKDDSFILAIMSHGKSGEVEGSDWNEVREDEILEILKNCSMLQNKPKIVFFQACRVNDGKGKLSDIDRSTDVDLTDFVVQYSAYEGTTSKALEYADPQKQKSEGGGWFVNTLQEAFKQMYKTNDLEEMLGEVGRRVQQIEVDKYKQCPTADNGLAHKLFFKIY